MPNGSRLFLLSEASPADQEDELKGGYQGMGEDGVRLKHVRSRQAENKCENERER